jgi:hypothetical protein
VDRESRKARIFGAQQPGKITIDLDCVEGSGTGEKVPGECAPPRADLNQPVAREWIHGARDALDHCGVVQEMLTEAFTAWRPG